jgi:2-polyprenyl-3-methyl-5-hydroxy-6-metoxy-1,4-benzoquinol methylase
MDQPGLEPRRHEAALRGLARVNLWSGSAGILWPWLADLARRGPVRGLDLATGAGDVPVRLWRRARRAGLDLQLAGCDRSLTAVEHARGRARRAGAAVEFFACDVLTEPVPEGYDVVTCSLFLHHLDEYAAVGLLRRMAAAARQMILVNDLVRNARGWLLAHLATRLLTTSRVVHVDGPRSVEGAFTIAEAAGLAEQAGLEGALILPRWPCRWLLVWRRLPR